MPKKENRLQASGEQKFLAHLVVIREPSTLFQIREDKICGNTGSSCPRVSESS